MKTFEEFLHREQYNSESKERAALKRRSDRQQTREERKRNKTRATYIAIVVAWGLFVAALFAVPGIVSKSRAVDTPQPESPAETTTDPFVETNQQAQEHMLEHSAEVSQNLQEQFRAEIFADDQQDYENEKIEAALLEMGYFRDDIPLDFETQAYLRAACEESGVAFELALAVIRQETDYRNIEGDNGDSIGYMQVQQKWHQERMNRLGVTDLSHPLGNFRVGLDYLRELMNKYGTEEALTAYNSGKPGESAYADSVMRYWIELK